MAVCRKGKLTGTHFSKPMASALMSRNCSGGKSTYCMKDGSRAEKLCTEH